VELDEVRAATGWELRVAGDLGRTPAPSEEELGALRGLRAPSAARWS
jgi:glutaconate CoA-transferase subunit B